MGWKGYEITIPVGMLFRRMYCHKCGNKLKKKKISHTYKKGEEGYSRWLSGRLTIGMEEKQKTHYVYECPVCNFQNTYDEQCIIAKEQKKQGKKIVEIDPKVD